MTTTLFPLKQVPGSAEALLRASVTGFKKPGKSLPDKGYTLSGLTVDQQQFQAFCELFGFNQSTVPSTYWHIRLFSVRALLAAHPKAPFPMPGMVHLSNEIKQYDVIDPQEPLDMVCRFGKMLAHDKGTAFETLTTLKRGTTTVWEENAINLYLGKKGLATENVSTISLDLNQPDTSENWQLPENLGFKYARISGDYNPIHLHPMGAKLFGFPRHLIHGWYSVNRCLAPFEHIINGAHEMYVSFKKPLLLPGDVMARTQKTDEHTMLFDVINSKEGYPNLKGSLKF